MELALKLSFIIKQITPSLWLHLKKKMLSASGAEIMSNTHCHFQDLIYPAVRERMVFDDQIAGQEGATRVRKAT